MEDGFKNWILVVAIISVAGIITYFAIPSKRVDKEENVLGTETVDYKYAPYITSIAPISIKQGQMFEYDIEVSDLDTPEDQINVFLTEKPMWMYIEGNRVLGIANQAGTYKYVVSVSDGINSTSEVNYILVEENE